jgi:hypothetical protein
MSSSFQLIIDEAQMTSVRSALSGIANGYETVMRNAINRTLSTVQTQAVARIANEMNLSSANIKGDFSITKATIAKIGGAVKAKGKPMELINFRNWTQTTAGIKIKIYNNVSAKIIAHAFSSYAPRSRMQIRMRGYQGARKPYKPWMSYGNLPWRFTGGALTTGGAGIHNYRGPIKVLTGPRIEDVFIKPQIFDPVTIQAQTVFLQRVDEEVVDLFRRLALP